MNMLMQILFGLVASNGVQRLIAGAMPIPPVTSSVIINQIMAGGVAAGEVVACRSIVNRLNAAIQKDQKARSKETE